MVEDGEEMDVPHPFEVQPPTAGPIQDAGKPGAGGSAVLGSMVLKKGAPKRVAEPSSSG